MHQLVTVAPTAFSHQRLNMKVEFSQVTRRVVQIPLAVLQVISKKHSAVQPQESGGPHSRE